MKRHFVVLVKVDLGEGFAVERVVAAVVFFYHCRLMVRGLEGRGDLGGDGVMMVWHGWLIDGIGMMDR